MLNLIYSAIVCILVAVFGGILGLIYHRYGTRITAATFLIALLFALLNTQLVRLFILPNLALEEYDEGAVFPAEPWRKVLTLDKPAEGFEFRPEQGLFLRTGTADVQLTEDIPGCLTEDGIAQFYRSNRSKQSIRETIAPVIRLPTPPETPLHKISFNIPIQDEPEVDTVILGASAFAIYNNGEVWCTEREVQRGQMIGVGVAFAAGLRALGYMVATFLLSFLAAEIGAIIILRYWLRKSN